jgi:hypothetical protein
LSRPLSFVSVGLLVGLFVLIMLLATVSSWGASVRPAEAASAVKVSVRCESDPEKTRVVNDTRRTIKVKKVGSIHQPRSNEPFRVNKSLRPGRAITFQSGYDANGNNVLTRQFIYDNEANKEGARVTTSEGRFRARC